MDTSDPSAQSIVVNHFAAAQRSMRIAYVTETYPPEVNGVAMTVARFVEGLHRRNHDVQLIRPRQSGSDPAGPVDANANPTSFHEVLMRGLPIPRYPHLRMGVPSKRALVKLWSQQRPDVVHIATEGPLGWSALQAAQHLKLPLSSDFRTNFHAYSRHYGIGWLHKPIMAYLRKFHNATQCTMVPTEALRRDLEAAGFKHLSVVSRGVDTVLFNPAQRSAALRQQWGVGPDDVVLLCVGRLAPEKNLPLLLQAFEQIRAQQPSARLVLVGDGPMRASIGQSHAGVIVAGQRTGQDLAAHYASADLFVFPSQTETFGNVTPEAMASGLPVLAYNYAAAAQMVRPGESGQLVALGDAQGFVLAATQMASQLEALRAMSVQARQRALSQDWESVVLRFENNLSQVIRQAALGAGVTLAALGYPAA